MTPPAPPAAVTVTPVATMNVSAIPPTPMAVTVVQGGPKGDRGEQGPPGFGSPQVFDFPNPLATWTVVHSLGRLPVAVTVVDLNGVIRPFVTVTNPDLNTTVVTSNPPLAGSVVIS